MRMEEGENIAQYVARIKEVVNKKSLENSIAYICY